MLISILNDYYKNIIEIEKNKYLVNENIYLYFQTQNIVLEWYSSSKNDLIADSIALLIFQIENHPNNQTFSHYSSKENFCNYKIKNFVNFLKTKYESVEMERSDLIKVQDENFLCHIEVDNEKFKIKTKELNNDDFEEKLFNDISFFETL